MSTMQCVVIVLTYIIISTFAQHPYCELPLCISYYDGCNGCACDSGNPECDDAWCEEDQKTAAICTTCDNGMYWLKFGSDCGYRQSCDSRFMDAPCRMENISTCACASGYYLHTTTDNTTACIKEANCPSIGQTFKINAIMDDVIFELPSDTTTECSYTYQVCYGDHDCQTGFYCDKIEEDRFYAADCVPLFCYLDNTCTPYDCLSDCVGIGYGRCIPTYWGAIVVTLNQQLAIWEANNVQQYVYSAVRSCECVPCDDITKFIKVQNGQVMDIVFDKWSWYGKSNNCTDADLTDTDRRTINDWFQAAISYATELRTNCDQDSTECSFHGVQKSLDVTYDDVYDYPTSIVFDIVETESDGGAWWRFSCFDAYSDGQLVNSATCDFVATFDSTEACAADTKECQDGSFVGRDPNNNCEFVECNPNKNDTSLTVFFVAAFFVAMFFVYQ